jgi:membrane protein DedA with SNARE-associated domain
MDLTGGVPWLERYSVVILPALVVAEQIGIPLPAVPALLIVGALAAQGRGSLSLVIGAIVLVALAVDLVWHELGRRRGARVLAGLCRMTLEPDVCIRRTENLFLRHGVRALLVSKFLPGLTTVMPPLAGVFGVTRTRFILYDVAGIVLWAGLWSGIGYVFSEAIEVVVRRVSALGHTSRSPDSGDPGRLRPAKVRSSMALSPAASDRPDLAGGPQAQARRGGGCLDHRPPHGAGCGRRPIRHSGQPMDRGRGTR